jgi:hypothetical protein
MTNGKKEWEALEATPFSAAGIDTTDDKFLLSLSAAKLTFQSLQVEVCPPRSSFHVFFAIFSRIPE